MTARSLRRIAIRRVVAALAAGVAMVVTCSPAVAPAGAAAGMSGAATINGLVTLTAFPCATIQFPPGCSGFFTGQVTATLSGTDVAGRPFTAVWPDPLAVGTSENLSASFAYEEPCLGLPPLPLPPPVGNATGQFRVSAGRLSVGTSGTTSGGAYVTGFFGWTRVGTVVDVQTWSTALYAADGTLVASGVMDDQGTATFLPVNGPGVCGSLSIRQDALVEGLDLLPS